MNKLATLLKTAILALSLFTVACTETEGDDTDLDSVSIDEPTDLSIDGETDTLRERAPSVGAATGGQAAIAGVQRPAHAPSGEPTSDRLGVNTVGTAPGQPGTGTAECVQSLKLGNGEPVVGVADSRTLGLRARDRFQQMRKIVAVRPVADRVQR
jgi:hypothetical protein